MASDSSNALAKFPSEKFDNQVLVSVAGDPKAKVVTITINNASKMNTMNAAVIGGVTAALELATDDTSVAVVVFTGAGDRAFCAGGNLQGGGASQGFRGGGELATATGAIRNLRNSMASAVLLRSSHFVSIAAVNGACAGAGLSWACACDIRVASATALFRAGFVTAGLSGDFGGTWTLPRIVGSAKARELYFLNEKIRAQEALRIGLVSKAFTSKGDAFRKEVEQLAARLAAAPPLALKRIKANLNDSDSQLSFEAHLDAEAERHARCGYHPDAMEAGRAFLQKRKPNFTGLDARQKHEMSRL